MEQYAVGVESDITYSIPNGKTLANASDVADVVKDIKDKRTERFVVLLLDTRHRLVPAGRLNISYGTLNGSLVHPREVFISAITRGSSAIVCAHNHPSGDVRPSKDDVELTRRLVKAGRLLGIPVLDRIIVGHGGYYSMRQYHADMFESRDGQEG